MYMNALPTAPINPYDHVPQRVQPDYNNYIPLNVTTTATPPDYNGGFSLPSIDLKKPVFLGLNLPTIAVLLIAAYVFTRRGKK